MKKVINAVLYSFHKYLKKKLQRVRRLVCTEIEITPIFSMYFNNIIFGHEV